MFHQLTWGLQGFFPFGICLGVDVAGDVVKGEKKVVLFMKLSRKLNLRLGTQRMHVMDYSHIILQARDAADWQAIHSQVLMMSAACDYSSYLSPHRRSQGSGSGAEQWNRLLW